MPAGRPSDYRAEFCKTAKDLAEQGATDREIAEHLEISEATIYRWMQAHPELREAIKLGKDAADDRVEQSLYRRAVGYSFDAVKINQYEGEAVITPYVEHVPPDVNAASLWLRNRRPNKWRDKVSVDMNIHQRTKELDDAELADIASRGRDGIAGEAQSAPESRELH